MIPRPLNIALIGSGRIGKMHGQNIQNLIHGAHVSIAIDPEVDRLWAESHGIKASTQNPKEALSDPAIDAVVIASPSKFHIELIEVAARAKKHIFCEKPVAFQPKDIEAVTEICRQNNVIFQVGLNRRFDPSYRRVKQLVDDGVVGTPQIVKITNRDPKRPRLEFIPGSGGLMMDFAVHDFDMLRYITGSDIKEVFVMGNVLIDPELKALGDIDTAIISVKMTSGALCTIDISRETHYGYDQRLEVFGNLGQARANNVTATSVDVTNSNGVLSDPPLHSFVERYHEAYILQLKEFVAAVSEQRPPLVSGYEAEQAVKAAVAAKESLRTGIPVVIEP